MSQPPPPSSAFSLAHFPSWEAGLLTILEFRSHAHSMCPRPTHVSVGMIDYAKVQPSSGFVLLAKAESKVKLTNATIHTHAQQAWGRHSYTSNFERPDRSPCPSWVLQFLPKGPTNRKEAFAKDSWRGARHGPVPTRYCRAMVISCLCLLPCCSSTTTEPSRHCHPSLCSQTWLSVLIVLMVGGSSSSLSTLLFYTWLPRLL